MKFERVGRPSGRHIGLKPDPQGPLNLMRNITIQRLEHSQMATRTTFLNARMAVLEIYSMQNMIDAPYIAPEILEAIQLVSAGKLNGIQITTKKRGLVFGLYAVPSGT